MPRIIPQALCLAAGAAAFLALRAGLPGAVAGPRPLLPAGLIGQGPDSEPSVVLVFSPEDCPGRLAGIDQLNHLYAEGKARVVGLLLVDTLDYRDWTAIIRANRVEFPVRAVPLAGAPLIDRLGYSGTPLYLALDQRGRLVLALESGAALPELLDLLFGPSRHLSPT
jgi:hypothetical protein